MASNNRESFIKLKSKKKPEKKRTRVFAFSNNKAPAPSPPQPPLTKDEHEGLTEGKGPPSQTIKSPPGTSKTPTTPTKESPVKVLSLSAEGPVPVPPPKSPVQVSSLSAKNPVPVPPVASPIQVSSLSEKSPAPVPPAKIPVPVPPIVNPIPVTEGPAPPTDTSVKVLSSFYELQVPLLVSETNVQNEEIEANNTKSQSSSTTESNLTTRAEESTNTSVCNVPSRLLHSLASSLFKLSHYSHRDFYAFEHILKQSLGFVISTRLTVPSSEYSRRFEYSYEVTALEGELMGHLVPKYDRRGCPILCRRKFVNENDSFRYIFKSPGGETLLNISGLDEDAGTEDVVYITQGDLRNNLGSVNFGFLGSPLVNAPPSKNKFNPEMITITRIREHMVPTCVTDMDGELAFIFKESKNNPTRTELLTADGSATVVAQMYFITDSGTNPREIHTSSRRNYFGSAYRIEIVDGMSTLDKTLIVGVGVTMFNRWLQKKQAQQCCDIL